MDEMKDRIDQLERENKELREEVARLKEPFKEFNRELFKLLNGNQDGNFVKEKKAAAHWVDPMTRVNYLIQMYGIGGIERIKIVKKRLKELILNTVPENFTAYYEWAESQPRMLSPDAYNGLLKLPLEE